MWKRVLAGAMLLLLVIPLSCTCASEANVETHEADQKTVASARLNGELTDLGNADTASVWFHIESTGFAADTPQQTLTEAAEFSYTLTNLSPSTTYTFYACALEAGGPNEPDQGDPLTFTTLSKGSQPADVTINFDSLAVPESGAAAIPKDQFKQLGVIFTAVSPDSAQRNDTFSVVRHLLTGNGAHSQPYAVSFGWDGWKLEASFVDPSTGADAVTDLVRAYVGDKSGEPDAITMTAYNIHGDVIASDSYTSQPQSGLDEATDFGMVEIAKAGIHRVVFTDDSPSGADMDDFAFNSPST